MAEPLLDAARRSRIQVAVLAWGEASGRQLEFRRTSDPYRVLVAETMAQQTQVARVEPAVEAFLATFPRLHALADAAVADVLRAWRGLGYNRRALNLRSAAQQIVAQHGGTFPVDLPSLLALPGVGPYTARAIAVHAFGARLAPVDTNVRRVLGRLLGRDLRGRPLQAFADELVPVDAAAWTNALMDIGATVCRPARPYCDRCPLAEWCATAAGGVRQRPAAPRVAGAPTMAFAQTSRWLRGRILDRLRDTPDGAWAAFDGPFGEHAPGDVIVMLGVLAAEGLLERHATEPARARLPR